MGVDHTAAFNLSLAMGGRFGFGTPRGLQGLAAATCGSASCRWTTRRWPRSSRSGRLWAQSDRLAYLPERNAMMLLEFDHFGAPVTGETLSGFVGPIQHAVVAIAWSGLFLGAAWFWFRRRDL